MRYLATDEYKRLLATAKTIRWSRLHALIRLAVESGARRGSLMALRWGDVDLDAGRAVIERTKNGTPHVTVLLPDTGAELRRFASRNPTDLVFASPRRADRPYRFVPAFKNASRGWHHGRDVPHVAPYARIVVGAVDRHIITTCR